MNTDHCVEWLGISAPKDGQTLDECEDAFEGQPESGRFAIADGATQSIYSALWAQLLVHAFQAASDDDLAGGRWIGPSRARWSAEVDSLEVPWYMAEKRQYGAFATVLGVRITRDGWRAFAVGDSCLFQLSEGKLIRSFPLSKSSEFDSRPNLIPSRNDIHPKLANAHGQSHAGDRLLLMTDALAEWSLRQCELGRPIWELMERIRTAEDLMANLAIWRKAGMHNDDVTFVKIVL